MTDEFRLSRSDMVEQLELRLHGDILVPKVADFDPATVTLENLVSLLRREEMGEDISRGVIVTDDWHYKDRRVRNHNNVFISWPSEDGSNVTHRQLQGTEEDGEFIIEDLARAALGGGVRYFPPSQSVSLPEPANDNQKSKFIDGQSLMQMEFEPIKYVIPGYVAEGLTILGGRPKLGKSWLSLDWVIAVATGGRSLGVDCEQGDAFYLALEDNQRRLQDRLKVVLPKMKSMRPDLSRVHFLTEAPKIGEGLIETLDAWRTRVEDPRLIVVDTLAMIRPPKGRNQDSYAADYAALSPLQRYASEHRLAVVVVTHVRKMEASDPLEMISGTNGLTGAADSIMVLDRAADGPKLYGRGRDVEEVEKALRFDGGKWSVLGNVDDVKRSDERRKIIEALGSYGSKLSPKDIAEATGMKPTNIRYLLGRMVTAGEVVKDGYGTYSIPTSQSSHPSHSDSSDINSTSHSNSEDCEGCEGGLQSEAA
ncbi:AAA family ATPase [Bradyrhizobium ottawaense]|uniref:AAA family ATPase n=1 Tax=Bradyrhizobium ottawaense TaxID=931866 RepID=UPI0030F38644